ncbi:MAG TPA: redox-sensing transcriptional repressor Rex [Verrucomicrobiae bacterium]|nr:redox-sensing transcriptional repressor Rex [Verrucomicrobiae bacterium]
MRAGIPKRTVYRLSVYLRCLDRFAEDGVQTASSQALALAAGVKPTQLRKDLTSFGHFGTRGLGYEVRKLRDGIAEVLGRKQMQPVVLVGVGHLGSALLAYKGFEKESFEIVAGFDVDVKRKRRKTYSQPILPLDKLESFVRSRKIRMGIVTVPSSVAQDVANRLVAAGVNAILNFAPNVLRVPSNVVVSNVNLAIELENLSYFRSLAES